MFSEQIFKYKKFDVCTFGSVTLDMFLPLEESDNLEIKENSHSIPVLEIPLGEKIQSEEAFMLCGGGASNSAVGFTKLGLKSAAFGIVGCDSNGRLLRSELKRSGVDTNGLVCADYLSSFSVILNTWDGKRTVIHHRTTSDKFNENIATKIPKTRAIYIGHLGENSEGVLQGITKYKTKNKKTIVGWNPGKTQFAKTFDHYKEFSKEVDYLILNVEEAEEFLGMKSKKVDFKNEDSEVYGKIVTGYDAYLSEKASDVRDIAEVFLKAGIKNVVITDGGNGAQIINKKEHLLISSKAANRKDTLGAGDAFSIGVIGANLHGHSLETQGVWAAKNSGSVIEKVGAQAGQLTLAEINN